MLYIGTAACAVSLFKNLQWTSLTTILSTVELMLAFQSGSRVCGCEWSCFDSVIRTSTELPKSANLQSARMP